VAAKTQRKTTTIQVSPSLNLVITKYATEQGISKAEAADRIFNILYPKGAPGETETSLAPPPGVGDEDTAPGSNDAESLEIEDRGEEEISDVLNQTVKDLKAVHTIRALSEMGNKSKDEEKITAKDLLEYQKIRDMGTGGRAAGTDALDATFRKYLEPLQDEVKELRAKVVDQRVADAEKRAADAEKKLEDKEAKEARAAEISAVVAPIQEQMGELATQLSELGERLKPEKGPESDELKAINTVAGEIRNLVQKLGAVGGGKEGGPQTLTELLDTLTTLVDKLNGLKGKFGGGEGEFDWRAATISTIGEVTTEALHTFRDIQGPPLGPEGEEETREKETGQGEERSQQVILRRVYNYAVKKIEEGELQLNPYDAAKELKLSANQVWWAVDTLRKRGLLKAEQKSSEKQGGEKELGRGPIEELPPGVEG